MLRITVNKSNMSPVYKILSWIVVVIIAVVFINAWSEIVLPILSTNTALGTVNGGQSDFALVKALRAFDTGLRLFLVAVISFATCYIFRSEIKSVFKKKK